MKKRLSILCLILAAILALTTACGATDTTSDPTEAPVATQADSTATEAPKATDAPTTTEAPATEAPPPAETIGLNEIIPASDPSKLPNAAKQRKGTLVVGFNASEGAYNPLLSSSTDDSAVAGLIFEGLITNDAAGKPIPLVAESWDVSADEKTYTFKLLKGVKFSNGEEVTAKDVAFTYTALCDPAYDGARIDAVEYLLGYEEYNKGDATEVAGIKVIDDYTISFELKSVKATGIWDFGYGILPQSVYGFEKGEAASLKTKFMTPVGCGPYKLVSANPSELVELTANADYFRGAPKIPTIIFKVTTADTRMQDLTTGVVDIDTIPANPENVDLIKDAGFFDLQLYNNNGYAYIGLNTSDPIFADVKVRQALTYGLDRQGFVDVYRQGYGVVADAPAAQVSWSYTDDVKKYPYDVEMAAKLLDEAGWVLPAGGGIREKDGKKLSFTYSTYTGSKYVETLIPMMVDDWAKIGVEVVPELMEWGTLTQKVYDEQDFQVYSMSWSLSIDPDPSGIFSKTQTELGGFNAVKWAPEASQKLIDAGLATTDLEERKAVYQEWYKLFMEECPYILLDITKNIDAVSCRVKGVNCSPYIGILYDAHLLELVED